MNLLFVALLPGHARAVAREEKTLLQRFEAIGNATVAAVRSSENVRLGERGGLVKIKLKIKSNF